MSTPISSTPPYAEMRTDEVAKRLHAALRQPTGIIICSLMLIVGGGWFSDGLNGQCILVFHPLGCAESATDWRGAVFSLILFLLGAAGLASATRHYLPVQYLQMRRDAIGRRGLIIAVSTPSDFLVSENGEQVISRRLDNGALSLTGNIDTDIAGFGNSRLNIQQFLRAVRPHAGENLSQVILLGSFGESGSGKHLQAYSKLLQRYVPCAHIHIEPQVDFEDVDGMYQAINQAVDRMAQVGKLREKDIVIDVTGGQKTSSIAAALATLHKPELEFQYVSQNASSEILTFNMVSETPARLNG